MLDLHNPFRVGKPEDEPKNIDVSGDYKQLWIIYDKYGQGQYQKPFEKDPITNPIRQSQDLLIAFNKDQQFDTYIIDKKQHKLTEVSSKSDWQNSKYSLYYFNRNSQVCLVEQNQSQCKARRTYYNFIIQEQGQFVFQQTSRKLIEGSIYNKNKDIFQINNEGKLGWYEYSGGNLQIFLFDKNQDAKKYSFNLKEMDKVFTQDEFKVLNMWQNDNLLLFVVQPVNFPSLHAQNPFSPILVANIENEGKCPVSFSNCKLDKKYHLSISKCINLQDYCVFIIDDGLGSNKMPYYVYNKELQLIVVQQSYNPKHQANKVYKHNTIVFGERINKDLVRYHERYFYCMHSLSYQKTLQLLQNAQSLKAKVKKAVVIFGGDKTGKSTLRHFLSGGKVRHSYIQQKGFYEVVAEDSQVKEGLTHDQQEEREKISWMNETQEAVIIDIPDWSYRDQLFKAQLSILISRILRIFQEFHFIISIPFEYIEDSQKNQEFFRNFLALVSGQEGIEQFITIVLTKVDSGEQSLDEFNQRIEQITYLNQQTGNSIRKIGDQNRILFFQNRQFDQNQGKQMLGNILSFSFLSFLDRNILLAEQRIQQPSLQIDFILNESEHYIRNMNTYLLHISYLINPNSFGYVQNIIESHIYIDYKVKYNKRAVENKEDAALAFISVLAQLRTVLTKQENQTAKMVEELKIALLNLDRVLKNKEYYFQEAVLGFVCVMRNAYLLPLENKIGKKNHPFADFTKILIRQSDAVLGKNMKLIIKYLQEFQSVRSSQQLKQFSQYISKNKTKIKKIVRVEMTYNQQKKQFLQKKGEILEKICELPSNALKLDLILEQLNLYTEKPTLLQQDLRRINFYLRQGSKVCQYHQLFFEAIILLVVIPDFLGIETLVDSFARHLKKNYLYENKKMLNSVEVQLIEKLLTISRECVRDNLVKKLINLQSLSAETFSKPSILRQAQQKNASAYLSTKERLKQYKQRLQRKDINFFYNLKDTQFRKMLSDKDQIVKKCQDYENTQASRKHFEDKQALRYVLDAIPLPKA